MNTCKAEPMTEAQRSKLLALAENPITAGRLLSQLDKHPKAARVLWDVYCLAVLTAGFTSLEGTV